MSARVAYEVQIMIEGEHFDLVKDPETTAAAIKSAVANAFPFLSVKKIRVDIIPLVKARPEEGRR